MKSETVQAGGYSLVCHRVNTLLIGSGAAALNAAVSLFRLGQKDIVIATDRLGGGTSNNTGSDKQTYYKLSVSGDKPDSVRAMAEDLFRGRCMHGDIALCEAQGSVSSFMRLVELGVPFPRDRYGSWAGYRTDNESSTRACSAGPLTSRMMVTALLGEVRRNRTAILDHHQVIELLTGKDKTRVIGAVAINTRIKDPTKAFVLFNVENIVLGTGGPGEMYSESVYPAVHSGSPGMAYRAGATGQNLTESQFGIASLKFRWNLSGSYQQVLPRYFSTDINGGDEKDFLSAYFPDYRSLTRAVFLKGYQWPFSPERVSGYGSSLIDLLVFRERALYGRKVFMDFRRNISLDGRDIFIPREIDEEARKYLEVSESLQAIPAARLASLNPEACGLFLSRGTDLFSSPLEIGICVQHNNGGLKGNIWWESDLRHLFPVGEVNGSHGVHRPGGSALNSGQAGSRRAAEFIAGNYSGEPQSNGQFLSRAGDSISSILETAGYWLSPERKAENRKVLGEIRSRMSWAAGIIRSNERIRTAFAEASLLEMNIRERLGAGNVKDLAFCFRISDLCTTHLIYLSAIKSYIEGGGRGRGSCTIIDERHFDLDRWISGGDGPEICSYDREVESSVVEAYFRSGKVTTASVPVREIPSQELWFEKVWKEFAEDNRTEG